MGAAAADEDFATPPPPARAPGGRVYQVGGVPVEFPYKPYGTQLAFMGRVIATLDRARRQGRSHALLESPTGTGKSLSLLCSALAWQRHYPLRAPPAAAAAAAPDPFLHGGGFVPDDTQKQATPGVPEKATRKKNVPTIYYATRTHAQITQVVREYRKTSYRVRMAILASRKHYCVNKNVCMSGNIDELWNAQKLSRHPSLQIGGCYEVHDIEDLIRVGRKVKGCPYFAAQTMAEAAQLVFCPYNYLISPIVRRAMDIDIRGSIIVLDEAHNIEDIARDAGSFDVDEESLLFLRQELEGLVTDEAVAKIYEPLHEVIQGLNGWIDEQGNNLQKNEFEHPASFWTGEEAMKELKYAGITPVNFPVLQECATKAIKAASDAESEGVHLSGGSAMTLESLFSSLSYFFAENGRHSNDYQLALQRFAKCEGNSVTSFIGWKCVMSLWCLNPAVVFRDIADLTLSVILTSGTLSPMGSFASELGVQFEACMEAPHVINADSQVFATVLSSGPTGRRLNASYRTANEYSFQDELGATLEKICRVVPGGALVFFPSYNLLEKLQRRWYQTEPRGSTEELEPVLKGYYNAILGKVPPKKGRGGAKQIVKNRVTKDSSQESAKGGAAFLAVCRGKVSEGIDFSDDKARVVLKKRYNDSYKSSKDLLSGNEWYCHQAFRALNQAAGRCIRHKFDYGGIILIDERYQEERNIVYISKWLRNSIRNCGTFQETMDGLTRFFQNAEEQIKIKAQGVSPKDRLDACVLPSQGDKRKLPWPEPNFSNQTVLQNNKDVKSESHIDGAGVDRMKLSDTSSESWHISSKHSGLVKKQISPEPENVPMACQLPPSYKVQYNLEGEADNGTNYEVNINFIDLEECDTKPRYAKLTIFNPSEHITQQSTVMEETYAEVPIASPSNRNGENASTVMNEGDPVLDLPISLSAANRNISCVSTSAATPERSGSISHLEHESWTNRSVNSHCQKRRKLSSPMSCCTYTERSCSPSKPYLHGGCDVSMLPGDLRTDGVCCKSMKMSRCENVKVERNSKLAEFPSRESTQEKLFICCARCKTALGLQEDGFLVSCSSSLSSKFYLTYLWRHGPSADILPGKDFLASPPLKIKVMVCNVSSVNKMMLGNLSNEGSAHNSSFWSEKDGCVYKPVTCQTCSCKNACVTTLGAQVVATDSSNQQFCDKVLLFDDLLHVKHGPSKDQAASAPIGTVKPISPPPVIDLESFAYKPLKKDPVPVNTRSLGYLAQPNPGMVHNMKDSSAICSERTGKSSTLHKRMECQLLWVLFVLFSPFCKEIWACLFWVNLFMDEISMFLVLLLKG
uniref:Helicase ATP-binding domain-containing protein n=1 Tax=Oryza rufipogon TaxID=4529 RepID=A0A0E0QUU1_ORYRU